MKRAIYNEKREVCLFSVLALALALATQGSSARFSVANKKIITDKLYDLNVNILKVYPVLHTLENLSVENKYEVLSHEDSSKAHLRFQAVKDDKDFLVKVVADINYSFYDCSVTKKLYGIDWIKKDFFNEKSHMFK
mgnify:CR=1 FL=1